MKKLKTDRLDRENFLFNSFFLPIFLIVLSIYAYYTTSELAKANKEVLEGYAITETTNKIIEKHGFEIAPEETSRHLSFLEEFRKKKLSKIENWTDNKEVTNLLQFKLFYDGLINEKEVNDFETISTEITGLADKAGIQITSIVAGSPQISKEVMLEGEDVVIFEKIYSLQIEDNNTPGNGVTNYNKLKNFLSMLRNDIKTPYNTSIEIPRGKDNGEEINFSKISLKFFYKGTR